MLHLCITKNLKLVHTIDQGPQILEAIHRLREA